MATKAQITAEILEKWDGSDKAREAYTKSLKRLKKTELQDELKALEDRLAEVEPEPEPPDESSTPEDLGIDEPTSPATVTPAKRRGWDVSFVSDNKVYRKDIRARTNGGRAQVRRFMRRRTNHGYNVSFRVDTGNPSANVITPIGEVRLQQ